MNETTSMQQALLWKEVRQVRPLIVLLLAIGGLLILAWSGFFMQTRELASMLRFLPLMLPTMYAAGVSAVLVSQEKELRTLGWLTAIPVSPAQLILSKFAVALAGLVVMWACCFAAIFLIEASGLVDGISSPAIATADGYDAVYFPLHSAFILICGMLTAWLFRNAFVSLIAIVPLALLPFIVMALIRLVTRARERYVPTILETQITIAVTVLATGALAYLAYRLALKQLAPAEAPRVDEHALASLDAWRPPTPTSVPKTPFQFPLSSLIWQSLHHNRLALAGILAMIAIGVTSATLVPLSFSAALLPLIGLLGISWLGVFVFSGDGSQRGLRFLADRGAAPTILWWGRQAIGLSLVACGVLLFAALSWWTLNNRHRVQVDTPSIAFVGLFFLLIYSVSQWASQVVRLTTAAAIVAPLLSLMASGWLTFAGIELSAPLWLLMFCILLPLVSSWWSMPRWMDGDHGIQFYLWSLVGLVPFLFIPFLPFAIDVAQSPRMSTARQFALRAEANSIPRTDTDIWQLKREPEPPLNLEQDQELTGQAALALYQARSASASNAFNFAPLRSGPRYQVYAERNLLDSVLQCATYAELAWQHSPDDIAAKQALQCWISDLTLLAAGLRRSDRWIDQAAGDAVEIWLTRLLMNDSTRAKLDAAIVSSAVALVADQPGRSASRRRAVLLSWTRAHTREKWFHYLNFDASGWGGPMTGTKRYWTQSQTVSAVIDASLRLVDAGAQGQDTQPIRRELHQLIVGNQMDFVDGPFADRFRVGAGGTWAFSTDDLYRYPAMQWFAPWEIVAVRLAVQEKTP